MSDLIERDKAIEAMREALVADEIPYAEQALRKLPSAQQEPLTDKEQRMFLAAMGRELRMCIEIDKEFVREHYEDSLMHICKEIERKVKGALWT